MFNQVTKCIEHIKKLEKNYMKKICWFGDVVKSNIFIIIIKICILYIVWRFSKEAPQKNIKY